MRYAASAVVCLVVLLIALLCGSRFSHSAESTQSDRIVALRQAAMIASSGTLPALSAMASGKAPYDASRAITLAERTAMLAEMASETFPQESRNTSKSMAREEVWFRRGEFDQLMKSYVAQGAALVVAAKAGSLEALRPAVADIARICKRCHEAFEDMP